MFGIFTQPFQRDDSKLLLVAFSTEEKCRKYLIDEVGLKEIKKNLFEVNWGEEGFCYDDNGNEKPESNILRNLFIEWDFGCGCPFCYGVWIEKIEEGKIITSFDLD